MSHPRRHPGTERNPFGELLSGFRISKGLTQQQLAYKLGKPTRSSIDAWERGLYLPETPETVLAIAEALSLSGQETNAFLLAARYAPQYGGGDSGTGDDNNVSRRSDLEELKKYLDHAVSAYEAYLYQAVLRTPSPAAHPYKFLDAFDLEDAPIFFGRDTATEELYKKVLSDRLTILHAKSGAGKTSLLHAGLSPLLIRKGRLPLYVRGYGDPVLAIKRLIAPAQLGPWPALLHELPFFEFIGLVCDFLSRQTQELIVILDQFEQFFLLWPHIETRSPFIRALGACYDDQRLPLRFIIALRKDYYSDMDEFNQILPHLNVFQNQYRLKDMTLPEAQETIIQPLVRLGIPVTYEPALLGTLLADLARPEMELPLLQIICTRLNETRDLAETQITLKIYEALGRAEGVLSHYLNDVLANLPDNEKPLAKGVLKALVRSDGMKQMLSDRTLAAHIEAQRDGLDRVLARLVNARLLHREKGTDEILYELTHEYLATEIVKWVSPAEQALKQAEELLRRELVNWRVHHLYIPRNRLEVLYEHRERFKDLDTEAWKCLISSALAENCAVADWAMTAGDTGKIVLFQALKTTDAEIRRRSIEALGLIGDRRAVEPLIAALKGEDREMRQRAAWALGLIGDPRAIEPLIAALKDEDREMRQQVIEALGLIGDLAIESLITILRDEDYEDHMMRWGSTQALGEMGDPRAVEPLIAALKDGEQAIRIFAIFSLGQIGDPRAVEPLIAVLKDGEQPMRLVASMELGQIGDRHAVRPLIAALKDEDTEVRRYAAGALGQIGDRRAVKPLIAALKDGEQPMREKVAEALIKIGTSEAIAALENTRKEGMGEI